MASVNEAWRVLSDPGRRAMYDASLRSATARPAATPGGASPAGQLGHRFDEPYDDGDVEFVPAPMWKHRLPFWALLSLGAMAAIFLFTAYAGSAGGPPTTRVRSVDGVLTVGSCARLASGGVAEEVDCGGDHDGLVAALIDYDGRCPSGTSGYRRHDGVAGYACLRRD
jgi:molecular chaperone DnaJ